MRYEILYVQHTRKPHSPNWFERNFFGLKHITFQINRNYIFAKTMYNALLWFKLKNMFIKTKLIQVTDDRGSVLLMEGYQSGHYDSLKPELGLLGKL